MATLAGSTIASTYTYLLKMDGTSGLTSSLVAVQDGDATDSALKISTTSASVAHTVTTAASTPKALFIDANTSGVAAQNATGMHIDFDRTVAGSGTAAHNDIGIDLDVNSASLGTSSVIGMDIDVVGATGGTHTATGLTVTVGSSDTNYAALFNGGNVGIGVNAAMSAPTSPLTISGDVRLLGYDSTSSSATYFRKGGSGSDTASFHMGVVSNDFAIVEDTSGATGTRVTVETGGNVGIGDDAPPTNLQIKGTGTVNIGLESTDNAQNLDIDYYDNGNNPYGRIRWHEGTANWTFQTNVTSSSTDIMTITGTGEVLKVKQPAFLAQPSSAQADFAADNSAVTVVFGTERFDQGGNFASNTFTAPATGKYQLNASLYMILVDSAPNYYDMTIVTSLRSYYAIFDPDQGQDHTYRSLHVSVLADMDTNDTAHVTIRQHSGTAQTDIDAASYFSGYLAC